MKNNIKFLLTSAIAILSATTGYAQRDFDTINEGNAINKITSIFGKPLESTAFEGEGGNYISLLYQGLYATIYQDDVTIDGLSFWSEDLCVLSSVVPGGIKVGDRMSDYKDIDFSKEVTGKHYEDNGFIPIATPYPMYPTDRVFNYRILSRGRPYAIDFAVSNDIIEEIFVYYLEDYYDYESESVVDSVLETSQN